MEIANSPYGPVVRIQNRGREDIELRASHNWLRVDQGQERSDEESRETLEEEHELHGFEESW